MSARYRKTETAFTSRSYGAREGTCRKKVSRAHELASRYHEMLEMLYRGNDFEFSPHVPSVVGLGWFYAGADPEGVARGRM